MHELLDGRLVSLLYGVDSLGTVWHIAARA
jgi:hypothetical protein